MITTSRLQVTGVTGGPMRITGATLVNGAYELATAGGADYELQTERQTMLSEILFIPGLGRDPRYRILIKTDNTGTSNSDQFTLPATGTYTVDWGDGVSETLTGTQTHTYPAPGNYVVRVTGGLTRINFNNGGDRLKLLEIQNWGNIAWTSMDGAYFGCSNMIGVFKDSPNLSGVTSLNQMFRGCTLFNSPIGSWNTAAVANMNNIFFGATAFNQDIGSWNTGNVTSMTGMFSNAPLFNQNIGAWNTGNVTGMTNLFSGATTFNNGGSDTIKNWDTSKVSQSISMFVSAVAFNQPIGSWDMSSNANMGTMFFGASSFNQDIGGMKLRLAGTAMGSIFNNANALSTENYSRTLIGWANYVSANSNTPASVTLGGGTRTYNNTAYTVGETYNDAVAARAYLTGVAPDPAWTITDGGEV
jgi:surface protein